MILKTPFNATSPYLPLTDAEMSAALGGTPVISIRPENIPYFNELRTAPSEAIVHSRMQLLHQWASQALNTNQLKLDDLSIMASGITACLLSNVTHFSNQGKKFYAY